MAIADYFNRDAVAISQVLHGFEHDVFVQKLERVRVGISIGENAATSRDGRHLLDLLVRLAGRLYPNITIVANPNLDSFAEELALLAKTINPNIEVTSAGTLNVCLAVGEDAPVTDAPTIFAGCDEWLARVGTQGPYATSDTGNPFGAGFAACIAAANLFRFLFLPEGESLVDADVRFPQDADSYPDLKPTVLSDPLVLVGVGAVGNAAAWALADTPLKGNVWLVDPEKVEKSNLQRYVLCAPSDEDMIKVDVVGKAFGVTLEALPHHGTWASFLGSHRYKWERVLVALDSAHDRRAVQTSLPRWIVNAWTQPGDLGVSTHSFLGPDACLACLYLPTQQSKSQDEIVAEGLKIPQFRERVRFLLGSEQPTDREFCDAIAAAWDIPPERLEPFVGLPLRELWVRGICGGGIIPLGEGDNTPRELHVPLAFQSALAGVLLAAEAVRDVLSDGAQRKTHVRRLDVLSRLGDTSRRPELKAGTGACICEDPDFIAAYHTKFGLEAESPTKSEPLELE